MTKPTALLALTLLAVGVGEVVGPAAQQLSNASPAVTEAALRPTSHPLLPADASQLWMLPSPSRGPRTAAITEFTAAVKLEVEGQYAKALPIFSQLAPKAESFGGYAQYYKGLAELSLGHASDAQRTFRVLSASAPVGFLVEAAALREGESDEALGDHAAALAIYERLSKVKTIAPEDVLMRVARAARAVGDIGKAADAWSRVYFEFPFSELSPSAATELDRLPNREPIAAGSTRYHLELVRAERLFSAKRYAQARGAFAALSGASQGDDRELVTLRIAECDYFQKRPRNTRDLLHPYIDKASRQGEALFFYAVSSREVGAKDEYLRLVRRLADDFPTQTWAEEALNDVATYYILQDNNAEADAAFREMYQKFPAGQYAERAAWKIGWAAYRNGDYREAARVFESGAATFPRSDYRPPWLYWSARAHEAFNDTVRAQGLYTLVALDYLNSYYGRLASTHLGGHAPEQRLVVGQPLLVGPSGTSPADKGDHVDQVDPVTPFAPLPANQQLVRTLLDLGLYDQAIDELRYAQHIWGDSSAIEATFAWIYQKQGAAETGQKRFALYRNAINTMKRAYPQFMAAGGEDLPKDVLRVIFPIAYWDLIRKYAAERGLDPYFVAALVAQESTFVPDIKSYAKAVGLMQLMPATARQYAKILNLKYSPKLLTDPEANIRMGTAYLADKLKQFGDLHLVLASYNAGERPVRRWVSEHAGVPEDEFIDDIPFPQTQGYVKKILGTAEDYRRLYGPEGTSSVGTVVEAAPAEAAPKVAPRAASPPKAAKTAPAKKKPAVSRKAHAAG